MGLSISSLFTSLSSLVRWSKDQDVRILMLGLDSAGKVRYASTTDSPVGINFYLDNDFIPVAGKMIVFGKGPFLTDLAVDW